MGKERGLNWAGETPLALRLYGPPQPANGPENPHFGRDKAVFAAPHKYRAAAPPPARARKPLPGARLRVARAGGLPRPEYA